MKTILPFAKRFFFVIRCIGFLAMIGYGEVNRSSLRGQEDSPKAISYPPGSVNTEYSRIYVFVDKSTSIGHQHAIEGKLKQSHLQVGQETPGELIFDMQSFDADTTNARKYLALSGDTDEATRKKVNDNMRGPEVLDVQRYPVAMLENAKLIANGKTSQRNIPTYELTGDFTLQKSTKPISATCEVEPKNGWLHVRGAFKIMQSDFGIKPFSKMFGAIGVKDELIIVGDLWIVPAS